jgi:hypothetical protein
MPVHPPGNLGAALLGYKRMLTRLREQPAWCVRFASPCVTSAECGDRARASHSDLLGRRRLKPARSAPEEGSSAPDTHVFSNNRQLRRIWRRVLNKAEQELQELQELPAAAAAALLLRRARRSDAGAAVAVEASLLELALRPLIITAIAGAARVFMRDLNTTTVRGVRRAACRARGHASHPRASRELTRGASDASSARRCRAATTLRTRCCGARRGAGC